MDGPVLMQLVSEIDSEIQPVTLDQWLLSEHLRVMKFPNAVHACCPQNSVPLELKYWMEPTQHFKPLGLDVDSSFNSGSFS